MASHSQWDAGHGLWLEVMNLPKHLPRQLWEPQNGQLASAQGPVKSAANQLTRELSLEEQVAVLSPRNGEKGTYKTL